MESKAVTLGQIFDLFHGDVSLRVAITDENGLIEERTVFYDDAIKYLDYEVLSISPSYVDRGCSVRGSKPEDVDTIVQPYIAVTLSERESPTNSKSDAEAQKEGNK